MDELPEALPCWECFMKEFEINKKAHRGPTGDEPDGWKHFPCRPGPKVSFECANCDEADGACVNTPALLEGNMQDLLDTINYMDKLMRAKSITTLPQETSSPDLFSVPTKKSIFRAIIKLGKGFEEIADFHRKDVEARRQQIAIRCGKRSVPSPRLEPTDQFFQSWNSAVRQFHQDVLTALRQGGMEEEMAQTILKHIPAKWIPSTNDDAVNAALEELSVLATKKQ
ncbi:hypothetical protein NM208_g4520 [Fusarium decemcellulare]|uniref:Uncharacterized protein n=1 Tax=Fusarium decemcellulare TaxID=57161 RepID=A0ACC1SKD1_9HYPO|nr:hypothetical protein NM208_g4520 [Fusarium decemcellulare]